MVPIGNATRDVSMPNISSIESPYDKEDEGQTRKMKFMGDVRALLGLHLKCNVVGHSF